MLGVKATNQLKPGLSRRSTCPAPRTMPNPGASVEMEPWTDEEVNPSFVKNQNEPQKPKEAQVDSRNTRGDAVKPEQEEPHIRPEVGVPRTFSSFSDEIWDVSEQPPEDAPDQTGSPSIEAKEANAKPTPAASDVTSPPYSPPPVYSPPPPYSPQKIEHPPPTYASTPKLLLKQPSAICFSEEQITVDGASGNISADLEIGLAAEALRLSEKARANEKFNNFALSYGRCFATFFVCGALGLVACLSPSAELPEVKLRDWGALLWLGAMCYALYALRMCFITGRSILNADPNAELKPYYGCCSVFRIKQGRRNFLCGFIIGFIGTALLAAILIFKSYIAKHIF